MRDKLIVVFIFFLLNTLCVFAQDNPPTISADGGGDFCPENEVSIASNVSITDPDPLDTTLDIIVIQISEGYTLGEDLLTLNGIHPNISASWNPTLGELTLSGNATFLEYETAIEEVTFQTTQAIFTEDKFFSINIGNANYLPSTGHYYFYVSDIGITWEDAEAAASTSDLFGLQGYLATITSEEESQLAGEQSSGTGWIGANDAETEGTWRWVTGPEAGTIFWIGDFNGSPQNGEYSFWNNNEPNDLGGEDYAHITDPSVGLLGSWNDLAVTGSTTPGDPYQPQGYLIEYGGMPGDPVVDLSTSTSLTMPKLIDINNTSGCFGDTIDLSVTSNTDTVLWYQTETSTAILNTGFNYDVSVVTTTTFWVVPVFDGCFSGGRVPVTASVIDLPNVNDITIMQCDDSNVNDGLSLFNINSYFEDITDGITANRTINYFANSSLTQAIDGDNYSNISNPQVVYAEVIDTNTGCTDVAQITLEVSTNNINNATLELCDDSLADGIESFLLTDADPLILSSLPTGLTIAYYTSYDDALLEQNQLPDNYENTTPFNQTVFGRVLEMDSCFGIAEIELIINPILDIGQEEDVIYCLNSFPETITLTNDITDSNFLYNWSTGDTTEAIEVNQTGVYTLDITNTITQCFQSKTFNVLPSNIATIDSVDVVDVSENNSITVNVSGEGTYHYALNSSGPYQDSNVFSNIQAGEYMVYVKDVKNDCGIVSQPVFVIGYPKFFTPNNDTVNDTWQIVGLPSNFQATFKVNIYDRFGKILYSMKNPNDSWDGRYNGVKLPTSDYWFTAFLSRGKYFTGHFTLKNN